MFSRQFVTQNHRTLMLNGTREIRLLNIQMSKVEPRRVKGISSAEHPDFGYSVLLEHVWNEKITTLQCNSL